MVDLILERSIISGSLVGGDEVGIGVTSDLLDDPFCEARSMF